MAINLSKGQKIDLTKTNPGLKEVVIGLGWDTKKFDGGSDFDLDASAFVLNAQGKCSNSSDFIFYNNPENANGSVKYLGDNRTGVGDGDDEQIDVLLTTIPQSVNRIAFTITIYEAEARHQNFGQISNAYVRIYNKETGVELINYDLDEDFSIETAIIVGELYRHNSEWKFSAVGAGYQGGLASLVREYGLE